MSRHPVIDAATCTYMHIKQCPGACVAAVILDQPDDPSIPPLVHVARLNLDLTTFPNVRTEPLGIYNALFK